MSDTVTLVLTGEISLADFATAMARLEGLVTALSEEVAAEQLGWEVADLSRGSAFTSVRGVGAAEKVDLVVRAYERVGSALERGEEPPYGQRVVREARGLVRVLNGRIRSVRFETDRTEAVVRSAGRIVAENTASVAELPELQHPEGAYGAVEGRVQTLTSRGGLRFTLFDTLNDRAVSCYLKQGQEDIMLDAWGKPAVVQGWVRRDPGTGHPETVRQITRVIVLPEGEQAGYRKARGAVPQGSEAPEEVIRRLRDA
ncbi:MAG: hypothetical protein ACREMD_06295 [Gemmatimonadota bacterium]